MGGAKYRLASFHNDWAQLCVQSAGKPLPVNTLYLDEETRCFCVGCTAGDEPLFYEGELPIWYLVLSYEVEGLRYDA